MNKIYLAYSSRDRSEAERVARTLEKNGFPCFMASRDLMPGQSWADTVITTIENAPMMIVIAGDNTFDSNQIIREISYASQLNKPILIAALIPHVDLHGAAYYYLAYSKSFDLTSGEGEQKMLSYVKELFDGIRLFNCNKQIIIITKAEILTANISAFHEKVMLKKTCISKRVINK